MTPAALVASVDAWIYKQAHFRNRVARLDSDGFDDLVSAGREGALMAASRFDRSRGIRFITYASPWIREFMRVAIRDAQTVVRVPPDQTRNGDATRGRRQLARRPVRLDEWGKWGGQGYRGLPLIERLPDPGASALEALESEQDRVRLQAAIRRLSPRGRRIVGRLARGHTQAAIAADLGVSRQRVQQLFARELATLREALAG